MRLTKRRAGPRGQASPDYRRGPGCETLLFVVEVIQFFLKTALGEHVFQFAPGRFALFRGGAFVRARPAIDEALELLILFAAIRDEVVIKLTIDPAKSN